MSSADASDTLGPKVITHPVVRVSAPSSSDRSHVVCCCCCREMLVSFPTPIISHRSHSDGATLVPVIEAAKRNRERVSRREREREWFVTRDHREDVVVVPFAFGAKRLLVWTPFPVSGTFHVHHTRLMCVS